MDHIDQYACPPFDLVITGCDTVREKGPIFPGAKRLQRRSYDDPDRPEPDNTAFQLFTLGQDQIGDFARALLYEEVRI